MMKRTGRPRILYPKGKKGCRKCGQLLPLSAFYRNASRWDGVSHWCSECNKKQSSLARNRVRKGKKASEILPLLPASKCKECGKEKPATEFYLSGTASVKASSDCRACRSLKYKATPIKHRKDEARKEKLAKYGIDQEFYDSMLSLQSESCAICGSDNVRNHLAKNFFIDHDHATGEVRGLLCSHCNSGIGLLHDDPELLERAIKYLRNPPARRLKFSLLKGGRA